MDLKEMFAIPVRKVGDVVYTLEGASGTVASVIPPRDAEEDETEYMVDWNDGYDNRGPYPGSFFADE